MNLISFETRVLSFHGLIVPMHAVSSVLKITGNIINVIILFIQFITGFFSRRFHLFISATFRTVLLSVFSAALQLVMLINL